MVRFSLFTLSFVSAEMSWDEFKYTYNKYYNSGDEDSKREQIFNENVQKIVEHNAKNEPWTMGVNVFADLTQDEFISLTSGKRPKDSDLARYPSTSSLDMELPASVDWVSEGVVNGIRNQGSANSCWAHSAAGTLESSYALATGRLTQLSEQQLCDCSGVGTCSGGGDDQSALEWYEKHGACARSSYPYKGSDGSCKSSCDVLVPKGAVAGVSYVGKDAQSWKKALATTPLSMGVYTGDLQHYASGVVTKACGSSDQNHAVIAVGYGSDGQDYFKIRNSWGTGWGEQGYFRVAQSSSSSRGVACIYRWEAAYPTIAGGPTPSPSPTPTPSPTGCSDSPSDWQSYEGDSCSVFESNNYCTPDGQTGSGWDSSWGRVSDYKDSSGRYSAFDACCACGGGRRGALLV